VLPIAVSPQVVKQKSDYKLWESAVTFFASMYFIKSVITIIKIASTSDNIS